MLQHRAILNITVGRENAEVGAAFETTDSVGTWVGIITCCGGTAQESTLPGGGQPSAAQLLRPVAATCFNLLRILGARSILGKGNSWQDHAFFLHGEWQNCKSIVYAHSLHRGRSSLCDYKLSTGANWSSCSGCTSELQSPSLSLVLYSLVWSWKAAIFRVSVPHKQQQSFWTESELVNKENASALAKKCSWILFSRTQFSVSLAKIECLDSMDQTTTRKSYIVIFTYRHGLELLNM